MTQRLELSGVTAGYSGTVALRDITVAAPAGRVTAIVGPNGAGKTTLLRVASGLLAASAGSVFLDGADVTHAPSHTLARRGVCHVPEGGAIFPNLTVRDNLRLFDRGDIAGAAERVVSSFPRLGERLSQVAGTLSGGEQRMLALARTYVTSPRYVLLDELSMGLAPKVVHEMFGYLAALAADGVALVLVEQYVHQALALADLVYVLNKGRVVFAGQPAEIDVDALTAEYFGGLTDKTEDQ